MDPYGSVWNDIKTGRSPMAPDHFWTSPDLKMAHKMAIRIAIRELPRDSRIADAMETERECKYVKEVRNEKRGEGKGM